MDLALFLARRIYSRRKGSKQISKPAVTISKIGIAVGLAVMIVAVAVVTGFKGEVRDKVAGFGAHLQLTNVSSLVNYGSTPVVVNDSVMAAVSGNADVAHVQRYSLKPAMVKTDDAFQGVVLKGVAPEYDAGFFSKNMLEGEFPEFSDTLVSNRVVLSKSVADKLQIALGDRVDIYFMDDNIRMRRLTVVGIFQTNLTEFDDLYMFTDACMVNRLNGWDDDEWTGAEILLKDYSRLEDAYADLSTDFNLVADRNGAQYCVTNIEQLYPAVFSWLEVLDVNIWVILALMTGIAGFTMISGLLIIIIERTGMIGLLKAQGASDALVRRTFLWLSLFIILRGVLWGDIIGLCVCFVQKWTGVVSLDPETYYMDTVPVDLSLWAFLALNAGCIIVSVLMLVGPTCMIAKIRPADSMRYE